MMRRVRKEDVQIAVLEKPDGLVYCLDCWKTYMQGDDRDLSASRMKLHAREDDEDPPEGYQSDPYGDQRKADLRVGEATDAMIDSLKRISNWAIYKGCGLATAWHFPNADFGIVFATAKDELEEKLRKNIVTSHKF
jgi:hypothetical protein